MTDKPTLTDLLRANTTWFIDPIVTFLARFKLSPDALTIAGMLSHFLFAWLIANGELLWAGVAIFFIAPLDALDGALARKLGRKQGGFGAFLDSTLDRLAAHVAGFTAFELTAFHDLVAMSGSLVIALALTEGQAPPEALWQASRIDEDWQVEQWGEDDEAAATAARRHRAFLDAARFFAVCR